MASPARSLKTLVILAICDVGASSGEDGINVAFFSSPFFVTLPEKLVVPVLMINVEMVIVEISTCSLNLPVTAVITGLLYISIRWIGTYPAGGVVSDCTAVVNDQLLVETNALPARSFASVFIVITYLVFGEKSSLA